MLNALCRLLADEVHVWVSNINAFEADFECFLDILDVDERQRASTYRNSETRRQFIVSRSLLRRVLGAYGGVAPEEIRFRHEGRGKPVLASDMKLEFNLSHSGNYTVIAVTRGRRVGVDCEVIREVPDYVGIAHRFFSISEALAIANTRESNRAGTFFAYWTCKEAYLKACGEGLFMPLDSFTVSFNADSVLLRHTEVNKGCWTVRQFRVADNYAAAIVAEGSSWALRLGQWPVIGNPILLG